MPERSGPLASAPDLDFAGRVEHLVGNYFRDEIYRAPEARGEWRARLVRDLQAVVEDALVEGANIGALAGGGTRSSAARMLAEFHEHPNALEEGTNTQALRRTLHQEEHGELMVELERAAEGHADLWQIARELADVTYVTYGTAWAFGIDLDAALREIHRAAMDKMEAGLRRADGKIMKPPGFVPPDMTEAVRLAWQEGAEDAR